MAATRMEFHLSLDAWDFIEQEKMHGSTTDAIEALFLERDALLNQIIHLNATAEQLGIEAAPLSVRLPRRPRDYCRVIASDSDQARRIAKHSKGYTSHSEATEHLIDHVKHLRKAEEQLQFDCARKVLGLRFIEKYKKAS